MKDFCIVTFVYNKKPSKIDTLCLKQLYKTCGNEDIYIVIPAGLDTSKYTKMLKDYNLHFKEFDPSYFKNTYTYSQLCLNKDFYESFNEYKYMCIIQTDVWMFRNEIQDWVNKGFDYVGPPILSKGSLWKHVPTVGNGGFSLRKISTFIDICDQNGELRTEYPEINNVWDKIDIEDKFICDILKYYWEITTPSWEDSIKFGWDQSVDYIYNNITKDFPMGAHAIDKCIGFWKNHIKEFSKPDIIKECYN